MEYARKCSQRTFVYIALALFAALAAWRCSRSSTFAFFVRLACYWENTLPSTCQRSRGFVMGVCGKMRVNRISMCPGSCPTRMCVAFSVQWSSLMWTHLILTKGMSRQHYVELTIDGTWDVTIDRLCRVRRLGCRDSFSMFASVVHLPPGGSVKLAS